MHKALPSTTLYYKACTNYFQALLRYKACTKHVPVLLCTTIQSLHKVGPSTTFYTKLAQSTSQHYFVLHSLHKALPSTTLYYKACTNYFPALLCTTTLAETTSQYYFVLQRLQKLLPSTTLYPQACTKPSQYYFVLQSLHKALPSTTLCYKACTQHYKACTKSFPGLLCTTKLALRNSQYYFVLHSLHKALSQYYFKACTKHFQYYFVRQNDVTTEVLHLPSETQTCLENQRLQRAQRNEHVVRDFLQFWHFGHGIKQVGMSQSATAADNLLGNGDETHGWAQQIEHVLRVPPILTVSARHQTGWSVTKCHACHEKRHDNLRGNIWKRRCFAAFPIDTELATRRRPNLTRRRRDDHPTRHSRRTRVQPPDYKREPFTTHSGKTHMLLAQSCWSEGQFLRRRKEASPSWGTWSRTKMWHRFDLILSRYKKSHVCRFCDSLVSGWLAGKNARFSLILPTPILVQNQTAVSDTALSWTCVRASCSSVVRGVAGQQIRLAAWTLSTSNPTSYDKQNLIGQKREPSW